MDSVQRKIYYYERDDGHCPFIDWRNSLNNQEFVDALRARLARVRLGLLGRCDSVGEGVLELKFDIGPGYRIYFSEWGKSIVVLLCGGDKNTQRRKDIALAKECWRGFRRSNC